MLALLGACIAPAALAQATNNPGYDRPGLGFTPAVLQAGDFTLEQGTPDWSRADGSSLYMADTLLRLGIGHALEVQLGTGWDRLDQSGSTTSGRNDTSLAVKFAPPTTGTFQWGLLGSVEFTDGAEAFHNARRQYLLGASFNWQRGANQTLGLYAQLTTGDSDSQLLAVNDSWTLMPHLGVYAELAVQHVAGVGAGSMAGAGLAWQATPRVQLDISARHRLSGHADDWEGGLGVSVFWGKL